MKASRDRTWPATSGGSNSNQRLNSVGESSVAVSAVWDGGAVDRVGMSIPAAMSTPMSAAASQNRLRQESRIAAAR